jgi:D-glycero-alpha-D-manno-heptose-7-phosphate kinase
MIISRTPLRISFAGGGTDLPAFWQHEPGAVLSTTIDKYIYVVANRRFEPEIRVSYSKTEIVDNVSDIQHDLVRESLRVTGLPSHLEVLTMADIPAGAGLGSSSSVTVGLLNALYAFQGKARSPEELAHEACEIEIDIIGKPIGSQDQYAAAYGGLRFFRFETDGTVRVEPVVCTPEVLSELQRNLILFFTGMTRSADAILEVQSANITSNDMVRTHLRKMKDLAVELQAVLAGKHPLDRFGAILNEGWQLKKQAAEGISTPEIEEWYEKALAAGALGGKLLGAGGGGCLLFYAPYERQNQVRAALSELPEIHFRFEPEGSKITFIGR